MKSAKSRPSDPRDSAPEPERRLLRWKNAMVGLMQRDLDSQWGAQLLRIASDMIVICDESLTILHHNRAFLKGIGYTNGSFRGSKLDDFFPSEERDGMVDAFEEWRRGHAAGMRFQADLLTTKGRWSGDFRVVRSKNRDGSYQYFLVVRDVVEAKKPNRASNNDDSDPFFRGLPVAAWRTDAGLRITQAFGSLWPELGGASADLIGELFGHRHDSLLPGVLQAIDCSDTLSGMSLQTEVEVGGQRYNVTVEPFLDAFGQVVGTVGMLRRAAPGSVVVDGPRLVSGGVRLRHHALPVAPPHGINIVTTRVPRFFEKDEGEPEPALRPNSCTDTFGLPS